MQSSLIYFQRINPQLYLPKELNKKFNPSSRKYLYNTLVMCEYLLNIISEDSIWRKRLDDLILKHNIDVKRMGFV